MSWDDLYIMNYVNLKLPKISNSPSVSYSASIIHAIGSSENKMARNSLENSKYVW